MICYKSLLDGLEPTNIVTPKSMTFKKLCHVTSQFGLEPANTRTPKSVTTGSKGYFS